MKGFPATTFRLAAVVALTVTLLSIVGMGLQYRLVSDRLMDEAERLLAADLDGFATLYEQRRIIALRQAIEYRSASGPLGEMLLLMNRDGSVLAGTHEVWPSSVVPAGELFEADGAVRFTAAGHDWLGVARDLPGGFPLLVARDLGPVEGTLSALRQGILALGLGMLAAGAVVGWVMARRVMTRIGRVNALADTVAAGDLSARLPGARSADEFGQLERHVHVMLDRIEALNRETHRLSDTIAHELRTPLNRMLQKLGRIEGQDEVTDDLRAEMRQTVRVFDALLDISRAEADQGHGGGLRPVDLSELLVEIWELYEPVAEDKGLLPVLAVAPGLRVLGDRTLISQMVANLLDNAVKYCRSGDSVTLTLRADGDRHVMVVADTGPGLPEDLRETVFDRFARGQRDKGLPGHGLGLALVRAIAARHGAKLSLPKQEKGFAIEIGWPKLADIL
ncbi:ATP-binding protein [Thioclava sp. FR2]|uniref:sensor histidine kinase n=1 Tax=Thioclava sp. FR2 TaxID=3445780 RepID=UPI003EC0829F